MRDYQHYQHCQGLVFSHFKILDFLHYRYCLNKCIAFQDKIVVGHSVFNDFKVLRIQHPGKNIRDTSAYKPLRALANLSERTPPSLKNLSQALLGKIYFSCIW